MEKRRQPEIIAGRVNADGSIAAGDGFTVAKGTAGIFTIRFASGFRLIAAVVTTHVTTAFGHPSLWADNSMQVTTYTAGGVATDYGFSFHADGVQQ